MVSQRPARPVIAYNYKLVAGEGFEANGAIVALKPLATKATVAAAKAKTLELEDDIYDNNNDNDDLDTLNISIPLSTP
jgi:hypothetical protein